MKYKKPNGPPMGNNNEHITQDDARSPSVAADALTTFGRTLGAFAADIITCAAALDGLAGDTRERVLAELAARLGEFGDLAHEARRAVGKL